MSRIGLAGMWHETNTYSTRPTTMAEFEAFELLAGDEITEHHTRTESVIGGFLADPPFSIVPIFSAGAWPSGPPDREVADRLLDRLDAELAEAGALDGLLVNLHGAMVAGGHLDFEGDTLAVIRRTHPDVPIVCVLDFHANPSPALVDRANVVVSYDTYPHVDMHDRGREAVRWMERLLGGGEISTEIGKHPLLTVPLAQGTETQPMAGLMARARANAQRLGIDRVCITGGFPYSDVERAGISVLVTTEGSSEAVPELIRSVLEDIDAVAEDFAISRPDPTSAVELAMTSERTPVVLADIADNIGGGSAGDSTAVLAQLLSQCASGALSIIADGDVARHAHHVGVGEVVEDRVGGKTDHLHGSPVPISGVVTAISDGRYRSEGTWGAGLEFDLGKTAVLDLGGVHLVVTEFPVPPFHVEQVTHLGIDPATYRIITAKGAIAWRAAYGDIAETVIEVDGPGACPVDLSKLERTTRPMRYP